MNLCRSMVDLSVRDLLSVVDVDADRIQRSSGSRQREQGEEDAYCDGPLGRAVLHTR